MIKSKRVKKMMAFLITFVMIAGIMPADFRSDVVAEEAAETEVAEARTAKAIETSNAETTLKKTTKAEETTTATPKEIPDLVKDKTIQGTKREYNPDEENKTYPAIVLDDKVEDFSEYEFSYHIKTEEEMKDTDLDNTKLNYVSEMPTIDNSVQLKTIIIKVTRKGYVDRYFDVEAEITAKPIEGEKIVVKNQVTYNGVEQEVVESFELKDADKYEIKWELTDEKGKKITEQDYKSIKIKTPGSYELEVEISRNGFITKKVPYTVIMQKGTISMTESDVKMFAGSYRADMSENAVQSVSYPESGQYEVAEYGVKKPGDNEYKYTTDCPQINSVKTGNYEYAVKIKRTDDENYDVLDITGLKVNIIKANQKIEFVDIPKDDVVFNDSKTIDVSAKAIGEDKNELNNIEDITYSIDNEGKKIAEIDAKTGKITFTGVGEIEVTASTDGTDNYNGAEVKAKINIVWAQIDFDKNSVLPKAVYKDNDYKWYNDSVELSTPRDSKWTMLFVEDGTTAKDWQSSEYWTNTLKINLAQKYDNYKLVFKNDKGEISEPYTLEKFAIDNKTPEATQFKIEKGYDKTYGLFANETLKVTVTVKDEGISSGIKKIHLYKYAADAQTILTDDISKFVEVARTDDGKLQHEATFEINIEPGFKGYIRATVEDNVGHKSKVAGPNKENSNIANGETGFIILENKAPMVSDVNVTPFNNVSKYFDNEKYIYNGDVEMSFAAKDEDINDEYGDMGSGIFQVNARIDTAKNSLIDETNNGIYTKLQDYSFTTENITPDENGEYKIRVKVTDNAGNITEKELKIGKDTTYPIITGFEFTPENNMDVEKDGNLYKAVEPTDYGFYFKKDVRVTVCAKDFKQNNECKSYVDTITYEIIDVSGNVIKKTLSTDKDGKISFIINKDFKGQIYAYATDKVGNSPINKISNKPVEADSKYPSIDKNGYVHPNGTIVEKKSKHKETSFIKIIMPKTKKFENKLSGYIYKGKADKDANMDGEKDTFVPLYNYDPEVEIVVADKYSGIKNIKYILTEGSKKTQFAVEIDNSGKLKKDSEGWEIAYKDKNVVTEISKTMRIKGNYNNMVLLVELTDRAGNVSYDYVKFGIDKIAPNINVSYKNNNVNDGKFFKNKRVATITVTERNFSKKDFKYKVTKNGKKQDIKIKWTKVKGKDNEKYVAKIIYDKDGQYKFNTSYTDLAGNKCKKVNYQGTAPKEFVIDKTNPSISVSFDNNSAQNGKFFKTYRTATVVVKEHNFDASRVRFKQTASLKGSKKTLLSPQWSNKGDDIHTAKILFNNDGEYTFDVTMSDKAGNQSGETKYGSSVAAKEFTIDTKIDKPIITGIENGKSYKGAVVPTIKLNDINYSGNEIKLTRTRMGKKDVDVTKDFIKNISTNGKGGISVSDTFKKKAEVDGIYTLTVKMTDKAGNKSYDKVEFTVNRYGSVYELNDYLTDINDGYIRNVDDNLVITEYNPDKLEPNSTNVQLTKDGSPIKDVRYTVTPVANSKVKKGESGWYQYEYKIDASNFKNDGIYKMVVSSKDKAGNKPESTNYKDSQITFRVDTTAPDISSIVGLEKEIVNAESQNVKFEMFDSIGLKTVKVYVDGKIVKTINKFDDLSQCADEIKLKEGTNQKVRLLAEDMAGNVTDTDSKEFKPQYDFNNKITISTNFFVRWYANKLAFWGIIAGFIILVGGAIILIMMKKKK